MQNLVEPTYSTEEQRVGKTQIVENSVVVSNKSQLQSDSLHWIDPTSYESDDYMRLNGYKYSVTKNCELRMAKDIVDKGRTNPKEMHHVLLAGGDEARTAGNLYFAKSSKGKKRILVTNESGRFCPSGKTLRVAGKILESMGLKEGSDFELQDRLLKNCKEAQLPK